MVQPDCNARYICFWKIIKMSKLQTCCSRLVEMIYLNTCCGTLAGRHTLTKSLPSCHDNSPRINPKRTILPGQLPPKQLFLLDSSLPRQFLPLTIILQTTFPTRKCGIVLSGNYSGQIVWEPQIAILFVFEILSLLLFEGESRWQDYHQTAARRRGPVWDECEGSKHCESWS